MKIGGYLKTSFNEWPGKVSALVFTVGCNFACPFCHNSHLVEGKSSGLEDWSDESILKDLEKRKQWLDAVVVTGGEPTIQPDLEDFLKKIKNLGFDVMLETNGSNPQVIAKLLDCYIVDRFAIDIKGSLDKNYKKIIKLPNFQIANLQKTLKLVIKSGIDFELRTTVVPGIHDEAVLIQMAKQILKINKNLKFPPAGVAGKIENCSWYLQNFQPKNCLDPKFNKIKPFSSDDLKKFQTVLQKIISRVELRGI